MTTFPRNPSGVAAVGPDYSILKGENFGFSTVPGARDDGLYELVQSILHRNCDAVFKLATPSDSTVSLMTVKLADIISTDLEARLSTAALRRGSDNDPQGGMRTGDPLDTWATGILAWAGLPISTVRADSQCSDDSQYGDDSKLTVWEADKIAPCFESFILFVAHHVKAYVGEHVATGIIKLEDCQLILPVANQGMGTEDTDAYSADYVDPVDFAHVACGMFPLGNSSVERQAVPASHLIVANAEIARDSDFYKLTELKLATRTKALYFDQHNRRFAWGLTALSRTIHAYIFGIDDIWASNAMDITRAKGRRAFISLLVGWSLGSVDRLGFDPTIRYVLDGDNGDPYLEIDTFVPVLVDVHTIKVERRTYFGNRCIVAAESLTGRRARYFAVSANRYSVGKSAFLIKDVWMLFGDDSACDRRESSFLKVLHAEFNKPGESRDSYSRILNSGPVSFIRGDTFVDDVTFVVFAGLPDISQDRQHSRTVVQWAGNLISSADDPIQVTTAVTSAMVALDAAYNKCKILHGNISDRAIQFEETADGIKVVLAEFDYATFAGEYAGEMPELLQFQSILSLEGARPFRSRLDDGESLLYLLCWLGTFGINPTERRKYAADYAAKCAAGCKPVLPIMKWIQGSATDTAWHKRNHMDTANDFDINILANMRHRPLRDLAAKLHKTLFLRPGCSGAKKTTY
ncbi:hypothetical protein H4S07_001714 [Coemansia furcata]|uniref:Uncharacterized protein n=1 Tax=Coemansia furcata TaxID=417177 RepID=A0ACC1LNQ7_9FUNG|nr:hypothetical protein H4S07_001714 [Coemansia furcata]